MINELGLWLLWEEESQRAERDGKVKFCNFSTM
jgi:hypothetical protein